MAQAQMRPYILCKINILIADCASIFRGSIRGWSTNANKTDIVDKEPYIWYNARELNEISSEAEQYWKEILHWGKCPMP